MDGPPLGDPPQPVTRVDEQTLPPGLAERSQWAGEAGEVDQAATEWVLRRAIELADDDVQVVACYPVASLDQVAAELQVPVSAVADALAEYRAGVGPHPLMGRAGPDGRTLLDVLVGPGQVLVRHHTGITEDAARRSLQSWLQRRHRLRSRVTREGTVVAVRRRGMVPTVTRSVRTITGSAGLSGVREVRGVAITAEPGHTSLCVVADVRDHRAQSAAAGTVVALGGTAVLTTTAALIAPVTLVGLPVVVGAGWAVGRASHWYRVKRVTEEVEETADQVAAGASPSSLLDEIGSRLVRGSRPARS